MPGAGGQNEVDAIPVKDGLCFRVIYGSGNVLEALMKGHLLQAWWDFIQEARPTTGEKIELSPLMYQLAEDLPKHTAITENDELIAKAARVIINRRDREFSPELQEKLLKWLNLWETWAYRAIASQEKLPKEKRNILGTKIEDLSKLLRFTAFWLDKMSQFDEWVTGGDE
jgi:CRISPR-associated protein Cmr2